MSDILSSSVSIADQLSAMAARFRQEKAAIVEQRKEIELLIKQAVAEVERAAQLDREVSSRMRQVESNPEAFPRSEIKRCYSDFHESRERISTWRGQLDQLRSRQGNLEKTEELLARVLRMADMVPNIIAEHGGPGTTGGASDEQEEANSRPAAVALQSIELAHHRLSRQLQDGAAQSLIGRTGRAQRVDRVWYSFYHRAVE